MRLRFYLGTVFLVLLTGCSTLTVGNIVDGMKLANPFQSGCPKCTQQTWSAQLLPTLNENMGRFYFLRSKIIMGNLAHTQVRLNKKVVGISQNGTVFCSDQSPGQYELETYYPLSVPVNVRIKAAETRFFQIELIRFHAFPDFPSAKPGYNVIINELSQVKAESIMKGLQLERTTCNGGG